MTEEAKVKRPASQYYWGEWLSDKALQSCSLAARGMWHEMNCWMHQSDPYGHLYLAGLPISTEKLANLLRISKSSCKKLLKELEDSGVFSRDENGAIFSRRMVRDEALRQRRAAGGEAGAEHGVKGAEHGKKGGRPSTGRGVNKPPLEPPPSSSSSSSSSFNTSRAGALVVPGKPATAAEPELDLDDDVGPRLKLVPALPSCPHVAILALWAELMPELQQTLKWTDARATLLRTRWREEAAEHHWTCEEDGLRFFAKLFRWCRKSPFLMGKTNPRTPGGTPFSLTLPWLTKAENWAKVQEGNFHPEG